MDLDLSNPLNMFGAVGSLIIVLVICVKYLIDHAFKQQEKLKNLEGKIVENMLTTFKNDIDGLGSKLRGFKSAMESFHLTVAEMTLQHRTLDLRVKQLEHHKDSFESSLEKKVNDILTIELYNLSRDKEINK